MRLIVTITRANEIRRVKSRFSRPVILRVFPHNRRIPRLELPTVWDQDASARFGTREIHWRAAPAVPTRAEALKTNVATALRREQAAVSVCSLTI
jgi:hypothetical protein